jgi:cobalt-zinc-cadmium efflux system protein
VAHSHGHAHTHATPEGGNARSLSIALALTGSFLVVEVVGGILTGSLALISDAAHMFTDAAALAIALAAIRIGNRPADSRAAVPGGDLHLLRSLPPAGDAP